MISLGNILLAILPDTAKAAVARRRQERELRGMEGRDLADLGIGRSEIPFLLHETKDERGPILRPAARHIVAISRNHPTLHLSYSNKPSTISPWQ